MSDQITPKMNPEVKKLWVEALRSGRYMQGEYQLRYGDAYCCLAVLCDLHASATGGSWNESPEGVSYLYLGEDETLPDEVREWAGFIETDPDPHIGDSGATELNDNLKYSFERIADLIEQYL